MEGPDCIDGVGKAFPLDLDVGNAKPRIPTDRQFRHRESIAGRRSVIARLVGWPICRDKIDNF